MFSGRIGIIQRVLAQYRKPLFEKLASLPSIDVSVFAGQPLRKEGIITATSLTKCSLWCANNIYWPFISGNICWQSGITRWLHTFNPDVLIVGADPRLFSSRFAILWMKRRHRACIGWGLGELPRSGPRFLRFARHKFARNFINGFTGVITYSSKAARDYHNLGVPEDRIFIAHNAIDNSESEKYLSKLGMDDSWLTPWRESLKFDLHSPILLVVGRLVPQKKVDMVIQACAPILGRCQLLIVGDGPWKSYLEEYAKPYKKHIRFVGHKSGEQLARCFIGADIFVLPGWGGLAIHQAMSYGKPVVVSFGDGTEIDLVREGINGVYFNVDDANDLREKLALLIGQSDKLRSMGNASLDIVRNEINLDKMIESFLCHITNS